MTVRESIHPNLQKSKYYGSGHLNYVENSEGKEIK